MKQQDAVPLMTLAVVLLWETVTMDCRGQPETVVQYLVRGQHVRLLGWTSGGNPSPIYSVRAPQEATTTLTEWPMSTEPLLPGDVVWWEVEAVDAAGNRSGGPCFIEAQFSDEPEPGCS